MNNPRLALVVPCYNEEEVLLTTNEKLSAVLYRLIADGLIHKDSFICFVDDGSSDRTWDLIRHLHKNTHATMVKGIRLSRNFGHQNALLSGLMNVKDIVDITISIDADLQDDINVIESMVNKYHDGYAVVYAVRESRDHDTIVKKQTAHLFYKVLSLLKVETIYNHADFRLTSAKALSELSRFKETNLYLRGIFPLIGLRWTVVYYRRQKRAAGVSKYPPKKMLAFAWNSITSFSIFPMRLTLLIGTAIMLISSGMTTWALVQALRGVSIPGWASTVIPIYFLGGLQMAAIGLLGEYIGKTYHEVKSRPRFIIEEEL